MRRYNHRLIERNSKFEYRKPELGYGQVQLIRQEEELNLENLRLLLLTDFLIRLKTEVSLPIYCPDYTSDFLGEEELKLQILKTKPSSECVLEVGARDFINRNEQNCCEQVLVGRLFTDFTLKELYYDFGLDVLRLYFIMLGPIQRDYELNWSGLVSVYHFVERLWELMQKPTSEFEEIKLEKLQKEFRRRLQLKKPHTAVATVMEFLKNRKSLGDEEIRIIKNLLHAYLPFLFNEAYNADLR